MRRPKLPRLPRVKLTIRKKVMIAFAIMCAATVSAGLTGVVASRRAGDLARQTYDQTVVTTSYAAAAASDFGAMRGELSRLLLAPKATDRTSVMTALHASFEEDIAIAVARADSKEITDTAALLRQTVDEWVALSRKLTKSFSADDWKAIDLKARNAERGLELMNSLVSRTGFAYRQDADLTVRHDIKLSVMLMTAAILLCGVVAATIARRINKPLSEAMRFADEVAAGDFASAPPATAADEFGNLAASLVRMRDHIGDLLKNKAELQAQSQARVAEALDGSTEGVLIATADGTVQIANARAVAILGFPPGRILEGMAMAELERTSPLAAPIKRHLIGAVSGDAETSDIALDDGRWIRLSRARTAEGGFVALFSDTTEARLQRDMLSNANANLDGALANMSQGLAVFDATGAVVLCNPKLPALLGIADDDCRIGARHSDIIERVLAHQDIESRRRTRLARIEQRYLRLRSVTVRTVRLGDRELSITQAPMPDGGSIATLADVTEQRRVEKRMNFLANHDALTQLPNRNLLRERVDDALARTRRGRHSAIHCLDLDRFKFVNDTLGHAIGDALLVEVAGRLQGCIRDTDTAARLGGDEFAILQTDVADEASCTALAERIIAALSAPYVIARNAISIGVSVGIAWTPNNDADHETLLRQADTALYRSKERGRGVHTLFAAALSEELTARRDLERDLRSAVENGEMSLHYQPLLDTATNTIGGFEALMRWTHPTRGMIPPSDFIPMAEETGLIRHIGAWAMETACKEAAAWPVPAKVSVNVSAVQLRDRDFQGMVTSALLAARLDPQRLEIEITESALMSDVAAIVEVLQSLRQQGVSVAMDDFGTGYSSLSSLNSFPFTRIKIDRSFVRDLHEKAGSQQIIRTVVTLGRTLGMKVTAEGVETHLQQKFLEAIGCDAIQGFLVGRPVPTGEVAPYLTNHTKPLAA